MIKEIRDKRVPTGFNGTRVKLTTILAALGILIPIVGGGTLAGMEASSVWTAQVTRVADTAERVKAIEKGARETSSKLGDLETQSQLTEQAITNLNDTFDDYRSDNNKRLERQGDKLDTVIQLLMQQ